MAVLKLLNPSSDAPGFVLGLGVPDAVEDGQTLWVCVHTPAALRRLAGGRAGARFAMGRCPRAKERRGRHTRPGAGAQAAQVVFVCRPGCL